MSDKLPAATDNGDRTEIPVTTMESSPLVGTTRRRFVRRQPIKIVVLTLVFTVLLFAITKGWKLNLYNPITYAGDALEMASYLGRDYVFNDLRERFFAPFGAEHSSRLRYVINFFFQPNSTLFVIAYSLTRDNIAALNLYYLFTFPLAFISAYWVYGRMKLPDPFRFGSAALYAMMPFHFQRGVLHLMESSYFFAPLLMYTVLQVFIARPYFHSYVDGNWRWSLKHKRDWCLLGVMVFLSGINEYHQLFFMMVLGLAALAASVRHGNHRTLAGGAVLIAAAGLATIAKMYLSGLVKEPGLELSLIDTAISGYGEEELYGLKLIQTILPLSGNPLAFMRTIRSTYDAAHVVNENGTVALGLCGAIGFVYLIAHGVVAIIRKRPKDGILNVCSLVTLCCVLIATVGGLGSVVGTVGTLLSGPQSLLAQVRCYNRIIVFIGFFSYYACSVMIMRLAFRAAASTASRFTKSAVISLVWLPIFGFSLWDQVPFYLENSKDGSIRCASDRQFFRGIEAQVAPHSLIFQYPFNLHHGEVNAAAGYNYADGIRPYLNSQTLRFTFGGDSGSLQANWLEETAMLPPERMVQRLCEYGFSGILVHRKLFKQPQREWAEIEIQLSSLLGTSLQESEDKDFSFASLDGFCATTGVAKLDLVSERVRLLRNDNLAEGIDFRKAGYPVFLGQVSGVSTREPWGRWTSGPVAKFAFKKNLPKKFIFEITANAFGPNIGKPVKVRVDGIEKSFIIANNTANTYELVFKTTGRARTLEIIPPQPTSPNELDPASGDNRKLGIGLISLKIKT
jgi:phosphoglycerol transferase